MPDTLLDSGSEFDRTKARLGQWLRDNVKSARTLSGEMLSSYGDRFVAGWQIKIEHNGNITTFDVLLDGQFPYSPIRVALKSQDVYLKWPHVEAGGLLCLSRFDPPTSGIAKAIAATLSAGLALVDKCQDAKFVEEELRREFLSYWNRSAHAGANHIRSLLDPSNHAARQVAVWYGQHYTLVAETADEIRAWLAKRGMTERSIIVSGVFGYLDQAPIPPFANRPAELCVLLHKDCPETLPVLGELPIDKDVTAVLAAGSPSGDGLIAMHLRAPNLNGFRKGSNMNTARKMLLWKVRSQLTRCEVDRFDAAWVHGRGLNQSQPALSEATVLVLGCGSLGSQVAMRLAQAAIGGMILFDPDRLSTANVGRHALGINSVGANKATELATDLRRRFPHMHTIDAWEDSWQAIFAKDAKIFDGATLIVACMGEWSADGQLGEWHARSGAVAPVVYGWLDEYGTAAHGLALGASGPSLSCVLSPDGRLRVPETTWKGDGLIQAEPACGTLYQPYGPIDVAHAEALVSRLCIDLLAGRAKPPVHRVYCGSATQIVAAGGKWSEEHLKHRPSDYDGPFEYERAVLSCGECQVCKERA